jgi:hypothetical protein
MARDESNLTERIQVLLSKEDLNRLHTIIYQEAMSEGKKPETISAYLRITIKNLIENKTTSYE